MTDRIQMVKTEMRMEDERRLYSYTFTIRDEHPEAKPSEPTGNLTEQDTEKAE